MCIGKLAGFDDLFDPTAFILLVHSSFPQRVDILGALCEHLSSDYNNLADYRETIALLRKAQKLRNKFMHNGMSINDDTGRMEMAVGKARGKVKATVEEIELADIRRASISVHEAQLALYKLVLNQNILPIWERR